MARDNRHSSQSSRSDKRVRSLKVFISFSISDGSTAEALYRKLKAAGADVYDFRQTARPGSSAWGEILEWISDCDVFIALISRKSLKSKPVAEEIDCAHYEFINTNRPSRLIPAILEPGIEPSRLLRRFNVHKLHNRGGAIQALVNEVLAVETGAARYARPVEPPGLEKPTIHVRFVLNKRGRPQYSRAEGGYWLRAWVKAAPSAVTSVVWRMDPSITPRQETVETPPEFQKDFVAHGDFIVRADLRTKRRAIIARLKRSLSSALLQEHISPRSKAVRQALDEIHDN
jgi:hypothetical protein